MRGRFFAWQRSGGFPSLSQFLAVHGQEDPPPASPCAPQQAWPGRGGWDGTQGPFAAQPRPARQTKGLVLPGRNEMAACERWTEQGNGTNELGVLPPGPPAPPASGRPPAEDLFCSSPGAPTATLSLFAAVNCGEWAGVCRFYRCLLRGGREHPVHQPQAGACLARAGARPSSEPAPTSSLASPHGLERPWHGPQPAARLPSWG